MSTNSVLRTITMLRERLVREAATDIAEMAQDGSDLQRVKTRIDETTNQVSVLGELLNELGLGEAADHTARVAARLSSTLHQVYAESKGWDYD